MHSSLSYSCVNTHTFVWVRQLHEILHMCDLYRCKHIYVCVIREYTCRLTPCRLTHTWSCVILYISIYMLTCIRVRVFTITFWCVKLSKDQVSVAAKKNLYNLHTHIHRSRCVSERARKTTLNIYGYSLIDILGVGFSDIKVGWKGWGISYPNNARLRLEMLQMTRPNCNSLTTLQFSITGIVGYKVLFTGISSPTVGFITRVSALMRYDLPTILTQV